MGKKRKWKKKERGGEIGKYVNDSLDIWRGEKRELKEKIKSLGDKRKESNCNWKRKGRLHFWTCDKKGYEQKLGYRYGEEVRKIDEEEWMLLKKQLWLQLRTNGYRKKKK